MKRYPKIRDFDTEEDYQQAWDDYFSYLDYVTEEYINDYEQQRIDGRTTPIGGGEPSTYGQLAYFRDYQED